jgi:hypothetical protein
MSSTTTATTSKSAYKHHRYHLCNILHHNRYHLCN